MSVMEVMGGLPPNIHLWESSHIRSPDGAREAREKEARPRARPVLCAGKSIPAWRERTPATAGPDKLREEVQLSQGLGSPLTWGIKRTPWRVDDPLEVSVLLPSPHPTNTPGTRPLPTLPQGSESPRMCTPPVWEAPRLSGLRPAGGAPRASP